MAVTGEYTEEPYEEYPVDGPKECSPRRFHVIDFFAVFRNNDNFHQHLANRLSVFPFQIDEVTEYKYHAEQSLKTGQEWWGDNSQKNDNSADTDDNQNGIDSERYNPFPDNRAL